MVEEVRYTSTAVRDGDLWRVQSVDYPAAMSLVTRLGDAAEHQREAIAFVAEVPASEIEVDVVPELPATFREHDERAHALREQAATASAAAAAEARAAARALRDAGFPLRDIGTILGVSYQRAHQLVSASA